MFITCQRLIFYLMTGTQTVLACGQKHFSMIERTPPDRSSSKSYDIISLDTVY